MTLSNYSLTHLQEEPRVSLDVLSQIQGDGVGTVYVIWLVKNLPANVTDTRDMRLIPGSARSPGAGNGNPRQYSGLENSIDRGAWRAIFYGVTKSWAQLRRWTHIHTHTHINRHISLQNNRSSIMRGVSPNQQNFYQVPEKHLESMCHS